MRHTLSYVMSSLTFCDNGKPNTHGSIQRLMNVESALIFKELSGHHRQLHSLS